MSRNLNFINMTVGQAQRDGVSALKAAALDEPALEARILLGSVLGGGPERVLADRDELLSDAQAQRFADLIARRITREPISHILGWKEFWSLRFAVGPGVLTPRPDSETIVEAALDGAVEYFHKEPQNILDLGTGSGCLLLALLSEWKNAHGVGLDASDDALAVARSNAHVLGFAARTTFVQGDWTQVGWTDHLAGPFDVIVSNPPYIPTPDIDGLAPDVREFDPMLALDGGASGLDAYRILAASVPASLTDGGICVFEVGIHQSHDVAQVLQAHGLRVVLVRSDLGGIERAVVGLKSVD